MDIELEIKNYRCFPDFSPLRIKFAPGFTSFIGTNNSGKSSLLRFFYEFRDLFGRLRNRDGVFMVVLTNSQDSFSFMPSVLDPAEVFSNTNDRDLQIKFTIRYSGTEPVIISTKVQLVFSFTITVMRNSNSYRGHLEAGSKRFFYEEQQLSIPGTILTDHGQPIAELVDLFRTFEILSRSLYVGPFRNVLSIAADKPYFDLDIGQSFIGQWREYKTGNIKKQNELAIKLTEEIQHIFGFKSLDINSSADGRTLSIFIDGKNYKLPELGSGISHFILVLTTVAIKKPSFILIDEPESNLHPSMQLDFLTTLASYSEEGIVWFATHSLGLARASSNRIYSFRRIGEGHSETRDYEATPRLSAFLGELSFPAYSELGFSKVLLVEGRTDVTTIQQFLRLYNKDHQVVMLPLGGNALINGSSEAELSEVKRISTNVAALIDSERSQEGAALSLIDRLLWSYVESLQSIAMLLTGEP